MTYHPITLHPSIELQTTSLHSHPSGLSHLTFPSLRRQLAMSNWSPHTLSLIVSGFGLLHLPVNLITNSKKAASHERLASYEAVTRRMTMFLHYGVYNRVGDFLASC